MNFYTLKWQNQSLSMIDQRLLPSQEIYLDFHQVEAVADAIKTMVVRGAPAIGVAAAYGLALAAQNSKAQSQSDFLREIEQAGTLLISQRPTAVNLAWAVNRILAKVRHWQDFSLQQFQDKTLKEAHEVFDEDVRMCEQMGRHGSALIEEGKTYLTHCNAGALATAGQGTALSVFYEAAKAGKKFQVIASETRPFLQGARLTSWELSRNGIPVTLITDNMVAHLMKLGKIHGVVVGSDRIVANGDVANKIGTYGAAILAQFHKIPFYVVAPTSTVDLHTSNGDQIIIEERHEAEVKNFFGTPTAPESVQVFNPAFDVTPHSLVTKIVTERGIISPPYLQNLKSSQN